MLRKFNLKWLGAYALRPSNIVQAGSWAPWYEAKRILYMPLQPVSNVLYKVTEGDTADSILYNT